MLYEKKIIALSNAVYDTFNGNLNESNMMLTTGDTIKQMIFFEEIYDEIDAKQTLEEIKKNVANIIDSNKFIKAYFVRELSIPQEEFNFIAHVEYQRWLKKQRNK